jgi:hypothetical protein
MIWLIIFSPLVIVILIALFSSKKNKYTMDPDAVDKEIMSLKAEMTKAEIKSQSNYHHHGGAGGGG